MDGGPRRLRVQRARLAERRHPGRRLRLPVHAGGGLRGRVLLARRPGDRERLLAGARRGGLHRRSSPRSPTTSTASSSRVGGTGTVAFVEPVHPARGQPGRQDHGRRLHDRPDHPAGAGRAHRRRRHRRPDRGRLARIRRTSHFVDRINAAWPDFGANAPSVFLYNYFNNTEAILQTIESPAAATTIRRPSRPSSRGSCSRRRSGRSALDDEPPGDREQLPPAAPGRGRRRRHRGQDASPPPRASTQTFGGAFSADTPTPDRENPECTAGTPGPWTEAITPEALGG